MVLQYQDIIIISFLIYYIILNTILVNGFEDLPKWGTSSYNTIFRSKTSQDTSQHGSNILKVMNSNKNLNSTMSPNPESRLITVSPKKTIENDDVVPM